jgi:hypothetical protein
MVAHLVWKMAAMKAEYLAEQMVGCLEQMKVV